MGSNQKTISNDISKVAEIVQSSSAANDTNTDALRHEIRAQGAHTTTLLDQNLSTLRKVDQEQTTSSKLLMEHRARSEKMLEENLKISKEILVLLKEIFMIFKDTFARFTEFISERLRATSSTKDFVFAAIAEISSKMGLNFYLGLSVSLLPLHGRLQRLEDFLCITVANDEAENYHVPIAALVPSDRAKSSLRRVCEKMALTQALSPDLSPDISEDYNEIDRRSEKLQSLTVARKRNLLLEFDFAHHSGCKCGQCPTNTFEFGSLSAPTTFTERNWRVHKQFDTKAALELGIDLLKPMRKEYSLCARLFTTGLMKHYYGMLSDGEPIDLCEGLSTEIPALQLPKSIEMEEPINNKSVSVVHIVKDSTLLDPAYRGALDNFMRIMDNLKSSNLSSHSRYPWAVAHLYGSWSVMLTLIAADSDDLRLYENIQSALSVVPREYNRDIVEQIVSLALRDAASKPWQYQETMDLTLFEATCHHVDTLIDLTLALGANAFTTVRNNASAFDMAMLGEEEKYVEKFMASAWNKKLLSDVECRSFRFDDLMKERDTTCKRVRRSVSKALNPRTPYFLTNFYSPRHFVDNDIWLDYSREHGISSIGNVEDKIPDLASLQSRITQLRTEKRRGIERVWFFERSLEFTWSKGTSDWHVQDLKAGFTSLQSHSGFSLHSRSSSSVDSFHTAVSHT